MYTSTHENDSHMTYLITIKSHFSGKNISFDKFCSKTNLSWSAISCSMNDISHIDYVWITFSRTENVRKMKVQNPTSGVKVGEQ